MSVIEQQTARRHASDVLRRRIFAELHINGSVVTARSIRAAARRLRRSDMSINDAERALRSLIYSNERSRLVRATRLDNGDWRFSTQIRWV